MTDNITLPREVVEKARKALTPMAYHTPPYERDEIAAILRTALAAEQPKHPGYVIGSHWLETAYSRICAGEAEADVLRDIGLVREEAFLTGVAHLKAENEALRRDAERLREALETMLTATTNDGKEQFPGHYSAFLEQVAKPRAKAALRREDKR